MRLTHFELEFVAASCARNGGQIGLPVEFFHRYGETGARAWLDAHLRAEGVRTDSRAPVRRERVVLFFDDTGQAVHGTLLESFVDERLEQGGTGLVTYRIVEHESGTIIAGQIWESPYACREAELGATP